MPMEAAEHYSVMISVVALINSNVEFWLGSTFACILAFHFAAQNMSKMMYRLIMGLYFFFSVLYFWRVCHAFYQFFEFNDMLLKKGFPPYPTTEFWGYPILFGTPILIFFGTVVCIAYMRQAYKQSSERGI